MRSSLTFKLVIAFLAISLLGAVLASAFARWITEQEFERLVLQQAQTSFMQEVTTYYQTRGSWAGVGEYFLQKSQRPRERNTNPNNPQPPNNSQQPPPPPTERGTPIDVPVPIILIDRNGYVLHPVPPYQPGEYVPPEKLAQGLPVMVNGKQVGTILVIGTNVPLSEQEQQYIDRTNRALLISALAASVIALLLGLVFARAFTRPIRALTRAIQAMARGETQPQVPVSSRDELGELSAAFNRLSADLARSNNARRQMTADIAHDLRTPLTIIGGYIESLRDGVLQPSAERYDLMHQEVRHLQHLVEDLRTLSLADAGELKIHCQPVSPHALLQDAAEAFEPQAAQKEITLHVNANDALPEVFIDPLRIAQVLGNLLGNAMRYTDAGGNIYLSAQTQNRAVEITIADDGAGIAPEALPHLFDRFYRADASRQAGTGASGLGLAISKSIVELHRGTIRAESTLGKGASFIFTLPVYAQKPHAA